MSRDRLNKDRFRGNWPQFKGELQKNWQYFTDDDLVEVEGDYDKFVTMVQKRCREKEEDVVRWTNNWYSKREQDEVLASKATISRNQM
ncbi:MAG: general stress protein CsbD [Deltaproteobacteria bacterium]|nr:general stress protein CsbD [Deltaproteobacteria bacterium]